MTNFEAQTGPKTGYSGAGPVLVSIAAALSSLAFFKIWGLFSISLAGPGEMRLSGADLADELKGPIPWVYVTPVAILSILLVSALRLMDPSPRIRLAYSLLLSIVAATLLIWPAEALAKITLHFSHLQIQGEGSMRLTSWWWIYCVSLVAVMTFGIIELATTIRSYLKHKKRRSAGGP